MVICAYKQQINFFRTDDCQLSCIKRNEAMGEDYENWQREGKPITSTPDEKSVDIE